MARSTLQRAEAQALGGILRRSAPGVPHAEGTARAGAATAMATIKHFAVSNCGSITEVQAGFTLVPTHGVAGKTFVRSIQPMAPPPLTHRGTSHGHTTGNGKDNLGRGGGVPQGRRASGDSPQGPGGVPVKTMTSQNAPNAMRRGAIA